MDAHTSVFTTCAPSTANPVHLFQIWGHTDVDTIHFGDATGIAAGTTHGDAGYIFIGSKTIARGGQDLSPLGDDGEDRFVVWYLQDADVVSSTAAGAGHSLTLDGQADTDYYTVYTTGSHNSVRNYVINVLDTGASFDGVDELAIYGANSTFNGRALAMTGAITTNSNQFYSAPPAVTIGPWPPHERPHRDPPADRGDAETLGELGPELLDGFEHRRAVSLFGPGTGAGGARRHEFDKGAHRFSFDHHVLEMRRQAASQLRPPCQLLSGNRAGRRSRSTLLRAHDG